MIILNLLLFLVSLVILAKSAQYAVNYSSRFAKSLNISEFVVSFFIISFVSVFPEATVSIASAIQGVPEFGLGTLLGSNVADLLLVFGIVALFSTNGIKVKSEILKNNLFYLILLLFPIILGFDGYLSRVEGIILILGGLTFFLTLSKQDKIKKKHNKISKSEWIRNLFLLLISLGFLMGGAYYTVKFGVDFANDIKIPAFLIALTIVAVSVCLPELIFSLKAVKTRHYELALGDILGTVITDATIIIGIIALINPFYFDKSIIYITGSIMVLAGIITMKFIKSEKVLTKKEGVYLLLFYILSLIIEFIVNRVF